jgi:hypothetical protein
MYSAKKRFKNTFYQNLERQPSNADRRTNNADRSIFPSLFLQLPSLFTMSSSSTSSISTKSTNTNIVDDNDNHEPPQEIDVGSVRSVRSSSARFVWPKIKLTDIVVNGKTIPGYRFLQDNNEIDRIFVNVVSEVEPYAGKHGEKKGLWEEVEKECKKKNASLFRDFDSRNGVDRLKAYKSFVSKYRKADKENTGCDNQQPPTKLLKKIENLVDKMKGLENEKDAKKNDNNKKKRIRKSRRVCAWLRLDATPLQKERKSLLL